MGIVADRTSAVYAAVLGVLMSRRTYVPLNPKFPAERNRVIVQLGELDTFVVNAERSEDAFHDANGLELTRLRAVWPADGPPGHGSDGPELQVLVDPGRAVCSRDVDIEDIAYLLFTSGTTGTPKGVPITHGNACAYVDDTIGRTDLGPTDRCSQTFDLTFDLSVHDMFVTWGAGACLYVLPENALMAPAKYIKEHSLTAWFSVPSTIGFMLKLRLLKPHSFPTLRYSWFCGEALAAPSARSWQQAAPNSVVENLYGPTEATIAFTVYRWRGDERDEELPGGIVPIGRPMGDLETLVIDDLGSPVAQGSTGELCLGGSQLSPGYWRDPVKTAAAFIHLAHTDKRATRWYRTGDLASEAPGGVLHFHGRIDSQVKILGHRVELGEIEHVLRHAAETDLVAAIAWPISDGSAAGVVAFVCGNRRPIDHIKRDCEERLAPYMVPKIVRELDAFPTNANGKIDRGRLRQLLETESS